MNDAAHLPSPLHQQLRHATKQPHHRIDQHPLLLPLLKRDVTLAQYGDALAALHGVQVSAEAGIFAFLAQQPGLLDYGAWRKLEALESDLAALQRQPFQLTTRFPAPDSVATLIGVLYTIEGATQGGQFIARNLHHAALDNLPLAFFEVYGTLTAQRWNEFWQFANAHCPVEAHPVAAATAVAMFDAIQQHLDACHSFRRT